MSEFCIKYSELESSVRRSQRIRSNIDEYVDELTKKIVNKVAELDESDSTGYLTTATELAWNKINSLNSKLTRFVSYETSLSSLISTSKEKDKSVSSQISTITDMVIEKRTWYEKAGDWIFNTFCVDLGNKNDLTRELMNMVKWSVNRVGNYVEKIQDWFKYGEGKYVWNIAMSVVGTVAAVGGALIAICGIPFTGGATVPIVIGCIGAAAATIGAIITTVNSFSRVKGNFKALSIGTDTQNIGAARYYGNTSTLSDEWEKKDMGDQATNNGYELAGKIIDTTKIVADTTSFACNIASLGYVKDLRYKDLHINTRINNGKLNEGFSFTYSNIKRNILNDMGYKVSSGKLDLEKSLGLSSSIFEKSYSKKFTLKWDGGSWTAPEKLVSVLKVFKVIKNVNKLGENIDTINDNLTSDTVKISDVSGTVESITGILGNSKFFSIYDDYGTNTANTVLDLFKLGEVWGN